MMPPVAVPPAPAQAPSEPTTTPTTLAGVLGAPATGRPLVEPTDRSVRLASEPGMLQQIGRDADEALAIGKRVLSMLNVESKSYSYNVTANSVLQAGSGFGPLAVVTQGDTDSQRDGDSLKLKGWEGNLLFTRGGVDAIVAYMFIQEGPEFITTPSQLFELVNTVNAPLSQPGWDSRLGFKVLSHGIHCLTNSDPYAKVSFRHKFNHDVQFFNNSTTVYEGEVSLWVISNNAGGGSQPTLHMASQLSWIDN